MNNNKYLIGAFVLVIIGGAVLYSNSMKKEVMVGDAMKAEGDAMMKHEGAMTGDAMKAEGDAMMMGAGVLMKGGKLVLEEGAKMTPLTEPYVFSTGAKVSLTGLVTKTDGTTYQLKEGESVWQDGSVMKEGDAMMMHDGAMTGDAMKAEGGAMMKAEGDAMMKAGETMVKGESAAKLPGTYTKYDASKLALAKTGDVVLNFRASWCPSCQGLHNDITARANEIPSDLTILEIDYDNSTALKQKYGVTYQHTFVQVDANGNAIKKWSGSPTLAALVAEVK